MATDSSIEKFREKLGDFVIKNGLDCKTWGMDFWKKLSTDIDQKILDNAFDQHEKLEHIFPNLEIVQRKPKQMSRIGTKYNGIANGSREFFKTVCDFIAGRINCKVENIEDIIEYIENIVRQRDGSIYIRGFSTENPYGSYKQEDEYKDITQYIYVYIKEIGYIVELQIGHEFASCTFTIDSILRDSPDCGLVDLWKDDFYMTVKNFILDNANGRNVKLYQVYQILDKAFKIHETNVLPHALSEILWSILK